MPVRRGRADEVYFELLKELRLLLQPSSIWGAYSSHLQGALEG